MIKVVKLMHIAYGDFYMARCSCGWHTSKKLRSLSAREAWHMAEEHDDVAHSKEPVPP